MPEPLIIKIDVTKIDKTRLFEGKNGAKYLDCVAWPTDNDQYGNSHRIVQSVTKEERADGVKGTIIGNAKPMPGRSASAPAPARKPPAKPPADSGLEWDGSEENIPF